MTRSRVSMTISPLVIVLIIIATIVVSVLASISAVSFMIAASTSSAESAALQQRDDPRLTSGMSLLNSHQCQKAETKQIILGGVEDNYLAGGEEAVQLTDLHSFVQQRLGPKGAVTIDRNYDEPGFDSFFLDSLEVPTNITSGIFVMRADSTTSETNDSFNIGDIGAKWSNRNEYAQLLADVEGDPVWDNNDDIFTANLADMALVKRLRSNGEAQTERAFTSLLTFIQGSENTSRKVDLLIGDDHIVDFFGFAVCLPPSEDKGLSFMAFKHPADEQYLSMNCAGEDDVMVCDPHAGDTLCSQALPLACMKSGREPIAPSFPKTLAEELWTGGKITFTEPVIGQSIATSADAHAMCSAEFGNGFRAATSQERVNTSSYIAKGEPPPTGRAWVHSKTEEYANCWELETTVEGGAQ